MLCVVDVGHRGAILDLLDGMGELSRRVYAHRVVYSELNRLENGGDSEDAVGKRKRQGACPSALFVFAEVPIRLPPARCPQPSENDLQSSW
jgi:hypothetical protein